MPTVSLAQYLSVNGIAFVVTVLLTSVTFGILYKDMLLVLRKTATLNQMLLSALLTSLVFHLPQFTADWLFYFPNMLNKVVDTFLLYPNPLLVFPYYWIIRNILGFSTAYALRTVGEVITGQYITMITFMTFSSLWASGLPGEAGFFRSFDTDMLAMISTCITALVFMLILKRYIKRRGRLVELPYNYPVPNTMKTLVRTVLRVSINYTMMVVFGVLMLDKRRTAIEIENVMPYAMMLMVLVTNLVDSVRARTVNILRWQERETNWYIQSLMVANEEFRGVKHDFYGMLQVYSGYISSGDMEGLKKYHGEMVATTTRVGNAFGLIEALRPRTSLYTLINVKSNLAQKMGVRLDIVGIGALVDVAMNDLDLCRMLGNLIENAIEGAAESENRLVEMRCRRIEGETAEVRIANSTKDTVDLEKIFEIGYTTKGNRHGEGLITVKGILALYGDCEMMVDAYGKEIAFLLTLRAKPPLA